MSDATIEAVDASGRVVIDARDIFELVHRGADLSGVVVTDDPCIVAYNALCRAWDKAGEALPVLGQDRAEPGEEIARRAATWLIDDDYATLDMRAMLMERCRSDAERERVAMEMGLFEARGLVPVLRAMVALVAHFRANRVVWGVGRGSSVASFCLYLLGIHRINSLVFGLDIGEFLKP